MSNAERSDATETDHLRALSDDARRFADSLSQLSLRRGHPFTADPSPVSPELVRNHIRARRARATYFDVSLFSDPAWDILLVLFERELRHLRTHVSLLGTKAGTPLSTTLRWLQTLEDKGLLARRQHPTNRRVILVELTSNAMKRLQDYFGDIHVQAET